MEKWCGQDDAYLIKLADQYKNDWKKIAKRIVTTHKKKVTPNFLKNRYKEVAGDHIKKGVKFTHDEDLRIAKLFDEYGTSWTKIAEHFTDRTPVMIKNRYYSHIRRKGLLPTLITESHSDSSPQEEHVHCKHIEIREQLVSHGEEIQEEKKSNEIPPIPYYPGKEQLTFQYALPEAYYDINRFFTVDEELHTRITPYDDAALLAFKNFDMTRFFINAASNL